MNKKNSGCVAAMWKTSGVILPVLAFLYNSDLARGQTWTGAVSSDWDDSRNWSTGEVPDGTSDAVFGLSSVTNISLVLASSSAVVNSLVFEADAPAYTFVGSELIAVFGHMINLSSSVQTIKGPQILINSDGATIGSNFSLGGSAASAGSQGSDGDGGYNAGTGGAGNSGGSYNSQTSVLEIEGFGEGITIAAQTSVTGDTGGAGGGGGSGAAGRYTGNPTGGGGNGGAGGSGGNGRAALSMSSTALTTASSIQGGSGGAGGTGGTGGFGGNGAINGGTGGEGGIGGNGGNGAAAIIPSKDYPDDPAVNNTVNNTGKITGGTGGNAGSGGTGGDGGTGGVNSGYYATGGKGGTGGIGGDAISEVATLINAGTISGGAGGTGGEGGIGGGGNGGSSSHSGGAGGMGGNGSNGGISVNLNETGSIANDGSIIGGSGGSGGRGGSGGDGWLSNAYRNNGGAGQYGGAGGAGATGIAAGNSVAINNSSSGIISGGAGGAGGTGGRGGHGLNGGASSGGASFIASTATGGNGGVGLSLGAQSSVANLGTISGGVGGSGGTGGTGAAGGNLGGNGGNGGRGGDGAVGGNGAVAVVATADSNTITNGGILAGGDGGNGGDGGDGGQVGQGATGGWVNGNPGTGGNGSTGGDGAVAVQISGSGNTLENLGLVTGGNGGDGGTGGAGGYDLNGGYGTDGNDGTSGHGSVAIQVDGNNNVVINAGVISGGIDGDNGSRADAIHISGSSNSFILKNGSVIAGKVVSTGNDNTLSLAGDVTDETTILDIAEIGSVGSGVKYQGFSSNFRKLESNTWTLINTTTATTNWTISGGALKVSEDATLGGGSSTLTLDGGALQYGANFDRARDISITANNGTVDLAGFFSTLSGIISGSGALTVTSSNDNAGTLTLSSSNTYSGGTTVRNSMLNAINSKALGTGAATVEADAVLIVSNDVTINNTINISGSASFNDTSSAGTAAIAITPDDYGSLFFHESSTAGNATITNGTSGKLIFDGNSTANRAKIINNSVDSDGTNQFGLDISAHNGGISIGELSGNGNVFLGGNTLTLGSLKTNDIISGVISDGGTNGGAGGALTKIGTGTLTLSGANTYTGGTAVKGGILSITRSSSLGIGAVSVNSNAVLSISSNAVLGNAITNAGDVIFRDMSSAGTASITNNANMDFMTSSSAGNAVITNNSYLSFENTSSAGHAEITNSSTGAIVFLDNSTADNVKIINNGVGSGSGRPYNGIDIGKCAVGIALGEVSGSGDIHLGNRTLTLGGLNTDAEISGEIADRGYNTNAGGSLTKTGTGKLILTGQNTYTGTTTVLAGLLQVDGSTAKSATTVSDGGTLQGAGKVGNVTVQSGGLLQAGDDVNQLNTTFTTGNLTFNSGSTLALKLDTSLGLSDTIQIEGNLILDEVNLILTDLSAVSNVLSIGTQITLLTYTGSESGEFLFNGQVVAEGDDITFGNNTFEVQYAAGDPSVVLMVVPEPSTLILVLLSGISFSSNLRRRK